MPDRVVRATCNKKTLLAATGRDERVLRTAAGLGKIVPDSKAGYFDKIYKHADVTVIGGGLAAWYFVNRLPDRPPADDEVVEPDDPPFQPPPPAVGPPPMNPGPVPNPPADPN